MPTGDDESLKAVRLVAAIDAEEARVQRERDNPRVRPLSGPYSDLLRPGLAEQLGPLSLGGLGGALGRNLGANGLQNMANDQFHALRQQQMMMNDAFSQQRAFMDLAQQQRAQEMGYISENLLKALGLDKEQH